MTDMTWYYVSCSHEKFGDGEKQKQLNVGTLDKQGSYSCLLRKFLGNHFTPHTSTREPAFEDGYPGWVQIHWRKSGGGSVL